ncbi:TetR family transcriptional regulator [Streptomyces sp. NPDC088766]|uniref:SbtR family transcriptional regulator n=1 Tax=Streptomyces sp. NPDC088766 TaxID=3365893 RepID=UPI003830063A
MAASAGTHLPGSVGRRVPLKGIARRAGVSHGTLYNLFGTREALIDSVVADLAVDRLDEAAGYALAFRDAWGRFVDYVEKVCELQATDPAVADVVSGRYPRAERLMAVCVRAQDATARIIERARRTGVLRPDVTSEDLMLVFGTRALLARVTTAAAPDLWRRHVAFLLDGLRAEAARGPLPVAADARCTGWTHRTGVSGIESSRPAPGARSVRTAVGPGAASPGRRGVAPGPRMPDFAAVVCGRRCVSGRRRVHRRALSRCRVRESDGASGRGGRQSGSVLRPWWAGWQRWCL